MRHHLGPGLRRSSHGHTSDEPNDHGSCADGRRAQTSSRTSPTAPLSCLNKKRNQGLLLGDTDQANAEDLDFDGPIGHEKQRGGSRADFGTRRRRGFGRCSGSPFTKTAKHDPQAAVR